MTEEQRSAGHWLILRRISPGSIHKSSLVPKITKLYSFVGIRVPLPLRHLIQIEIANGFAGVWGFFGFLNRFLKFLFQKIASMFLGFHRLAEDGFAAAILFLHGFRGGFEIVEGFRLNRRSMGDDASGYRIDFQHRAAAGAGYIER